MLQTQRFFYHNSALSRCCWSYNFSNTLQTSSHAKRHFAKRTNVEREVSLALNAKNLSTVLLRVTSLPETCWFKVRPQIKQQLHGRKWHNKLGLSRERDQKGSARNTDGQVDRSTVLPAVRISPSNYLITPSNSLCLCKQHTNTIHQQYGATPYLVCCKLCCLFVESHRISATNTNNWGLVHRGLSVDRPWLHTPTLTFLTYPKYPIQHNVYPVNPQWRLCIGQPNSLYNAAGYHKEASYTTSTTNSVSCLEASEVLRLLIVVTPPGKCWSTKLLQMQAPTNQAQ